MVQTHYEMMLSASPPRPATSPGYDVALTTSAGHVAAERLTLNDVRAASPPPAYTVLDVGPPPSTQTTPSTPEHSRRPLATSGRQADPLFQ